MTYAEQKLQAFDTKLLSVIQQGNASDRKLMTLLADDCKAINSKDPWRVIRCRLNALKRRSFIQEQRAGFLQVWSPTKQTQLTH